MDILPVIKLMEQDLEPLEAEMEEDEDESGGANFVYEEKTVLPEVQSEKPNIAEEEIFVEKKPVKKKRVMSEAQKENLKRGREKALAVRRANAQEKKEIKELTAKKKKKDIQKLRDEVGEAPRSAPAPAPAPAPIPRTELPPTLQTLDPDMIRKLQEDAIDGYEKKRMARKELKKKDMEQTARNQKSMDTINNAIRPVNIKYGEKGFFNHLF
tara:strand:- start:21778 stop:22413 length:636 start_codon:yes stop_codon:yes gene_type:complete